MTMSANYESEYFRSFVPGLVVPDAEGAIGFYVRAFGAMELARDNDPGGGMLRAELRVGDILVSITDKVSRTGTGSACMIGDHPGLLWLYVPDVDKVCERAVRNGATVIKDPSDEFWGARLAVVEDPFGHRWSIATHTVDVPPELLERLRREAFGLEDREDWPTGSPP
jgi:uncharacterized glyoxalase superfamily protein PhnB